MLSILKRTASVLSFSILFMGCLTMSTGMAASENLSPGQVASDDLCYITGKIQVDIPDENIPPEPYRAIFLGLERIDDSQENSPEIVTVGMNEVFYKAIPKGRYILRSLTYSIIKKPLNGEGISLLPVNAAIDHVEFDLGGCDFAYLGDLFLSGKVNNYGNLQRYGEIKDRSPEHNLLTAGWLIDKSGNPMTAENISSAFNTMIMLDGSLPTTATGYEVKAEPRNFVETEENENIPIERASKVAFLSVDNNKATSEIVRKMDRYAREEFKIEVIEQDEIRSMLPEYPAVIYGDNFSAEGKFPGSFQMTEEYNDSFDSRALELANTLGVEYLYILYHINGISYNTNDPSYMKQGIAIEMRGRLFSSAQKKSLAYSHIVEKEEIPLFSQEDQALLYQQAELDIYDRIAQGIVDRLYMR